METLNEILAWATALIDSLAQLVTDSPLTYLIIFAMAAVDVLFPVLPAEATITAAAVLAGQGTLSIGWVILAAGIGAFVGDNVAYWVGRAAGRPLVRRVLRGDTRQLDAVAEQFARRGGMFIIVGRFIPGGRTAVAIGAGVLHFSWPRFILYDALAAVIWSVQAALPGFLGGFLIQDRPWLAMLIGFAFSIVLAGAITLMGRRRAAGSGSPVLARPAVVGIDGVHAAIPLPDAPAASEQGEGGSVLPAWTDEPGAEPAEETP